MARVVVSFTEEQVFQAIREYAHRHGHVPQHIDGRAGVTIEYNRNECNLKNGYMEYDNGR